VQERRQQRCNASKGFTPSSRKNNKRRYKKRKENWWERRGRKNKKRVKKKLEAPARGSNVLTERLYAINVLRVGRRKFAKQRKGEGGEVKWIGHLKWVDRVG